MKRKLFILFLLGCVLFVGCGNSKSNKANEVEMKKVLVNEEETVLKRKDLIDKKVSALIPVSFDTMSDEELEQKYPENSRPNHIFIDDTGNITITFRHTTVDMDEEELESYLDTLKTTYTDVYEGLKIHDSSITTINNKQYGYIEMEVLSEDGYSVYNLLWFGILDGKLQISSFNANGDNINDWKQVGKLIFYSMK